MTIRQWHIIRAYATLDELERMYRISAIREVDANLRELTLPARSR